MRLNKRVSLIKTIILLTLVSLNKSFNVMPRWLNWGHSMRMWFTGSEEKSLLQ